MSCGQSQDDPSPRKVENTSWELGILRSVKGADDYTQVFVLKNHLHCGLHPTSPVENNQGDEFQQPNGALPQLPESKLNQEGSF